MTKFKNFLHTMALLTSGMVIGSLWITKKRPLAYIPTYLFNMYSFETRM